MIENDVAIGIYIIQSTKNERPVYYFTFVFDHLDFLLEEIACTTYRNASSTLQYYRNEYENMESANMVSFKSVWLS